MLRSVGLLPSAPVAVAALGCLILLSLPVPAAEPGHSLMRFGAPGLAVAIALWAAADVRQRQVDARERQLGLQALMRGMQHGFVVFDADRTIVEWSSGAEALLGYTSGEVVRRSMDALILPEDHATFRAEVERALTASDWNARFSLRAAPRDGSALELEVFIVAWRAPEGRVVGALLRDISKQRLVERRIGETEKNWRDIVENSSDVLLLLDRAGTIIFANRGVMDRAIGDVVGSNVSELLPHLQPLLEPALTQVFEAGTAFEHEGRAEGEPKRWLWCRFAPQREDGEVARAVLSISDLSERRARDQQLRRMAGILENTRDAVFTTDADGNIASWNPGAELLWGLTAEEVHGQHISTLIGPERQEAQQVIFERARSGRYVEPFDSVAVAKNLRRIPVSVSIAASRNEEGVFEGISVVARDMSHYQDLQDAMEQAKSAAETANRLKSAFIANMSHEVRTPLNGVVGMADVLRKTSLTREQEGYVSTMMEACQALRVVVDDVLDFSKIEAGQLDLTRTELDLGALARAAVDMFRPAAAKNGTTLALHLPRQEPWWVMGDANRIRQVLTNLVSNAVKFSPGGRVDVSLRAMAETDSSVQLRLEVADTGVGIASEAQPLIFQPFAQADGSITRRFGGTGLGLSICRKLTELMGGKIGFESEEGRGSQFWVELELTRAKSSSLQRGSAPPSLLPKNSTSFRVLVAEDNEINQKVVSAMLQGLGCSVDIAANGVEAVALWRVGVFDLILMDCQMPIMSGFEATEVIRKEEGAAHIPIIAMTAQAYAQDRERCLAAGMDEHVAKPLTKSELKSVIAKWLRLESTAPQAAPLTPPRGTTFELRALERLAVELGDGGRETLSALIGDFLADFPRVLERLQSYVDAGDWARVSFEAHRARSSTGNLAAVELAALCKALEECGMRADAPRAAELVQELRRELGRAREALERWCRTRGSAERATRSGGTRVPG